MAKADGSVIINTRMDSKSFASGAKQLSSKGAEACQKLSAGFSKLGVIIGAALSVGKIIQFGAAASKAAREYSDALIGLQSIVEGQGRSFSNAQAFIEEYTKDGLIPATNAITAYKNLALRGYDDSQIKQVMIALKDASAYGRAASYSMGYAVQSATEGLKNENSILVDNAGVTKNVAKMWDEYAASIGTTANNLTQQQKIQAEVVGIMAETKFQTGDAAKVSGTLSGQLQQLSFNFNSLKVAVGGIVNPIVQYVLPAINAAVAGFTKLANAAAQVVSVLFGKVSTSGSSLAEQNNAIAGSAIAGAEAEEKLADATKAAGKAAKQSLAGFDELNTLQDKAGGSGGGSPSTGGSSGGGVTSAPTIEATTPEVTMPDWAQMMIDKLKAGNWAETATIITQQLNQAVASVNWGDVGNKIAGYMDGALAFLATAILTFDWFSLGSNLGTSINSILDGVDWTNLGVILGAKLKIVIEGLGGFFATFDWSALGRAIADTFMGLWNAIDWAKAGEMITDGVVGAFKTISTALKKVDWLKIGKDIIKFFANINLSGISSSFFNAIGAALAGVGEFIWGLLSQAWSYVSEELITFAVKSGGFTIEGLLLGILKALGNIALWIHYNIFKPIADGFCEAFGIHSPSTKFAEFGRYIIEGLLNGIKNTWNKITTFFSASLSTISTTISTTWNSIKTTASTTWSNIKNILASTWESIKSTASTTWSNIKNILASTWESIKSTASTKFTDTKNKILDTWNAVKNSNTWNTIKSNLYSAWDDIRSKAESKFGNIRDTISSAWKNAMGSLSGGNVDFSVIGTNIKDAFASGINKLIAGLNDALYRIIYKINDVILDARAIHFSILGKTHYPFLNIPTIPQVAIPYLAKGAVIPPNAPFMAMLGDQKYGTNIEAPLSTIQEAVALVLEDMTGGLMAGFEATVAVLREILEAILGIEIGDTVIAEAVERYNRKMSVVKGG